MKNSIDGTQKPVTTLLFSAGFCLRMNMQSSNNSNQRHGHLGPTVQKCVTMKSLVNLSSLAFLSSVEQQQRSSGRGKINFFEHATLIPHFHFHVLSFPPALVLFSTCSLSSLVSCSVFHVQIRKPATYHRSPERRSHKSWRYTADLTGHQHKDPSVSPSL